MAERLAESRTEETAQPVQQAGKDGNVNSREFDGTLLLLLWRSKPSMPNDTFAGSYAYRPLHEFHGFLRGLDHSPGGFPSDSEALEDGTLPPDRLLAPDSSDERV